MTSADSLLYLVIGVFSVLIGALGFKRNIGSIYAFLLSVTLTPLVGLVITLCTNKYSVRPPKISKAIKLTGIVLIIIGLIIAIMATMILKESSENYEYYDKGPMSTMIKTGLGLFLLGLFNVENGKGKTFANISENEKKTEETGVFKNFGQTEPSIQVENKKIVINTLQKQFSKKIHLGHSGITIVLLLALILLGTYIYHMNRTFENHIIQESEAADEVEIKGKNEFAQQYLQQVLNNETQTFRAKGQLKAYNGDWQFKIPNSFNIYEGDQPHVLIKMGNINNPYVAMAVGGHNLNYDFIEEDVEDFFSNSTIMSEFISGKGISIEEKRITIDGKPGYMAETEYRYSHIDKKIKIRSLTFFFINNKCLFNLTCSVTTDDMSENLSFKMNEYREFFKIVAGTIIMNKNY